MKDQPRKILTLPLRLGLIILILGALFKVMHWPYSKELMFIGAISIGVLYIIRFIYKKEKSKLDYVKLSLVIMWLFYYLTQVFHLYNIPYIVEICLVLLFFWWFTEEGVFYFKNQKFKTNRFLKITYYLLIGITSFLLLFGMLFKTQHWPYGSLMFTLGVVLLCVILILDYFRLE